VIHRNVFHNEELLGIEKVRWSPGQAGLICGWGLFTTVRITQGEAFAYERHWRRLEKDAALTRLPLTYSGAKVRVHLQEVIRANKVTEGCARIYLIWNTVGGWKSDENIADVDLLINHRRPAAASGERAADSARTRAARGFASGGSENDFVVEQCVGLGRGTSGRV